MKPTCGPLPCVTTTPQPVATSAAMWRAVSRAFSYCSSIEPRWPSRMSALPPIATTARRSIVMPQPRWARPRRASAPRAAIALEKQASGARAIPAPICPTPARRWAMPVLMTGAIPESTTRRASIPVGVPTNPSGGSAYDGLRASVIRPIRRVNSRASAGLPPTKRTIAGAAAIANPPIPNVSVIALSPRSGLASSGP